MFEIFWDQDKEMELEEDTISFFYTQRQLLSIDSCKTIRLLFWYLQDYNLEYQEGYKKHSIKI